MTEPDIAVTLIIGRQAAGQAGELQALHAEVYGAAPGRHLDDSAAFASRFAVQARQPGFVLAEARSGGYLVGYAAGMPLRTSTSWWRHLTTALPDEAVTERPGRTFALADLLVRAAWRRQGIGRALHDRLLARPEERATVTVLPAATAAQRAFGSWGWRKVGRTRDPQAGQETRDVLLVDLPVAQAGQPAWLD